MKSQIYASMKCVFILIDPHSIHISWIMLLPELLVFVPALSRKLLWPSYRRKRTASALEHFQLGRSPSMTFVDAVHFDPVSRACHMETPVPRRPNSEWLSVHRIVPTATHNFHPTFNIAGHIHFPRSPSPFVFLGEAFERHCIPAESSIRREFHSFWPASTAGVCPPFAMDLSVVDDDLVLPRRHDCGADWHFLDLETICRLLVVFPAPS